MNRQEELEKVLINTQNRIYAAENVPEELMAEWLIEFEIIILELNNLYDDDKYRQTYI